MTGGWLQWPFDGGPANATYGQLLVMIKAVKQEDTTPRPLPNKVWQDFLRNRKRNVTS